MALDTTNKYWTWQQFNAKVDELCPLESKRLFGQMCAASTMAPAGTAATPLWNYSDGSSVYYRDQIRQAVLDLQNFIPEFCKNHETIYYPQDFAVDGMASVGALPPMAKVTDAWYYSVTKQRRVPVVEAAWEQRFTLAALHPRHINSNNFNGTAICQTAASLEMIATFNEVVSTTGQYVGVMAISPGHERFYLHPRIENEWVFSLFWNGHKLDFRDAEQVPFEEEAAQAVALFVRAAFLGYVERNLADAAQVTLQYNAKRSNLYLRCKSKGFLP
jgi:hypothetical protein